jgi:SAM-dependent methyltransferase
MDPPQEQAGLAWQIGVWNRISDIYLREIDRRFAPVVEHVIARAQLAAGDRVLDLGTGTGAVAARAARLVGPDGLVVGVDISADMLRAARQRVAAQGLTRGLAGRERELRRGAGLAEPHVCHRSGRRGPRAGSACCSRGGG